MKIIQVTKDELNEIIQDTLDSKFNELISRLQPQKRTEYLTRKETKELLQVSYVTLNNWRQKEVLMPHHIGNKVLYKREDIENSLIKAS